jgi:large repetitive protein
LLEAPVIKSFAREESSPDDATNLLVVSGTSTPNSTVSLFSGDSLLGSTEADAVGNWTTTIGLSEGGDDSLVTTATNADGGTSAPSVPVTISNFASPDIFANPSPVGTEATAPMTAASGTIVQIDGTNASAVPLESDSTIVATVASTNDVYGLTTAASGTSPNLSAVSGSATTSETTLANNIAPLFSLNTVTPVTIAEGTTVEIDGTNSQPVTFEGTTGTLRLDNASAYTGQISGLAGSDAIDLTNVSFSASTTASFLGNTDGGTLTITDGTHTSDITLVGNYLQSTWDISSDGNGGTTVVDPVAPNNWQTLDIGAGGYISGIDIAPDGTMVGRTDTSGAYIWNGTSWQQLVTATSMPAAFVAPNIGEGVYEIQVAASNSEILYMSFDGDIFKSSNDGANWTETNFSPVSMGPNDPYRGLGQKMAIDPNNPNVVYAGTAQNGLFVTTDGGNTWNTVSAVPTALSDGNGGSPGITGILFDPALGGVTGGKTNTIFAASYGHGVYESTNGGTSWTALSGGPTDIQYAAVSTTGAYYATNDDGNSSSLWRYMNGTWTNLLTEWSGYAHSVAVDPFNPNEIVVQSWMGSINVTYDGGATWTGYNQNYQLSATDIPWLADSGGYLSTGGTEFNPLVPNELITSAGVGVWTTNLPAQGFNYLTPFVWQSQSLGFEQLVANEIVVAPGGHPVLASWDRPFFYVSNETAYPSNYSPNTGGNLAQGWALDYASSNPNFLVGIADWYGIEESGYSTNGGQTWNVFPNFPSVVGQYINGTLTGQQQFGGTIAASTPENIIWAPSGGVDPYYTLDGGNTWTPITLPGVTTWSNFDWAYYLDEHVITADRVLPNTFYLFDADVGVFKSTNGGVNWTQVYSGGLSSFDYYNALLESVPGQAGNLFFTGGSQAGGTATQPVNEAFLRSTDGGATWTAIPNVLEVQCFGFGAAASPGGYPSIYIVGYVNNVYGIWQSTDDAKSWVQIGTYPTGSLTEIKTISGDPNIFGQVYIGFSGDGYAYLPGGPLVAGVAASPSTGIEVPGNTITLTLTMGEVVTVTGTPTLALNDGGTAIYSGGSGTAALTFSYTVSGSDSDVSALAITQANLPNGATITNASGNNATLTGALTTFSGLQIDPPHPQILSIAETPSSGHLDAGKTVSFTLNFSEAVTVAGGTPTLTLNDGGTATYTGGSGTSALTFTYTVGAGQTTSALATTVLNLNAASINDAAGNTAALSLTGLTQSGPQIDTTAPTVSSVVASGTGITSGTGDLVAGHVVTLTVNLSEAVTVTGGTPTLTLNDGGAATYTGGSGTNALTFSYTVGAGQNTPDLMTTAVNLNGANITDGAGNAANLAGAVSNLSGVLQIETTPPMVSSVVMSSPYITNGAGDLNVGKWATLTLNLSAAVTVAGGTPTLTLNDGGTATYSGGSGSSALTFTYTVGAGQNTAALAVSAINLNTASITDGAGNAINLLLGGLTQSGPQIDTTTPTVLSLVESPSSGDLDAGKTVTVTYNMSEAVTVAGGIPTLTFNDGGTATYTGGSGTTALTFSYTVGAGQNTVGLIVSGVNQNGATITDGAGNAAFMNAPGYTGPQIDTTAPAAPVIANDSVNGNNTVTLSGTAEANSTLKVFDGSTQLGTTTTSGGGTWSYTTGTLTGGSQALSATATDAAGNVSGASNTINVTIAQSTGPTVASVVASGTGVTSGAGDLNAGHVVTLTINLSEAVTVSGGTPTLTLNDGGTATYSGGSGTSALTFSYTVGAGQNTADLAVTAVNLNSASVTDSAGNAANLAAAVTNPAGTLQIDTTAPVAPTITAFSPDSGVVGDHITNVAALTLTGSAEANATVKVYDGATLLGSATANASGAWTYTTAVLSNGAHNLTATATDAAGNVSSASGAMAVTVDTTAPLVTQTTALPTIGLENPGDTVILTVTLSEAVNVTGTPTLTLNDGGKATYTGGSGTNTLTFSYTISTSDSDVSALAITAVNLPNGATVQDAAGNNANLAAALVTFPNLAIDPPPGPPTIASISPDSGVVGDGVTNATVLTLTGTGVANSTVKVYDGSTLLGTASTNASGAWSFTTGTLSSGTHNFTATVTDIFGNVSPASGATAMTVDTTAPVAPSITSFSPDTGIVGDHITNATILTLTGTAEANSTVKVYDGAVLLGTATTNGSGAWSFTTGTLASGAHSLTATATDAAGNVSVASSATAVTVDTTAPVAPSITSFSPDTGTVGDHITDASTVTLTGTAEANSTVKVYDGATLLGTASTNGSGAWSFTAGTLASGAHNLTATATDAAGNVSVASSAMPVTIDTTAPVAPTIASLTPDNGIATGSGTLALDGHGFTNKPTWSNSASVSLTTTKAGDVIVLDVVQNGSSVSTVTDTAGLTWHQRAVTGSAGQTISEYYAIAPNALSGDSITVTTAGAASYMDLNAFAVSGANTASPFDNNLSTPVTAASSTAAVTTSNANDFIVAGYRFGSDATPAAGSGWTAINAASGYYLSEYKIVSTTQAGLVATASTGDQNGGIVDAIAQATTTTSANVLTLTGAAEANATINVYDGATLLGSTTTNGSGAWSFTTGTLADGTHNLSATATDVAGNVSIASSAMPVIVDTTAPVAPSITSFSPDTGIVGDHITNATTLTLTGTAEANSTVKVYDGATLLGSATTNGSGAWSFATGTLASGGHTLSATATDAVGNVSVASSAMAVTIDATAPVVTQATAVPSNGLELPGDTVTVTVAMSEAVTVTGTPTLTLNDGGKATYSGGSGTNALTFVYTVSKTDMDVSALAVTAVNLPNGATVQDAAGNNANLSGALVTFATLAIDPPLDAPTIAAFSPDSGVAGDGITNVSVLTLTGTADANTTVNVYDGATLLGSATANGSGAWSFITGTLAAGGHSFTAIDTAAGKISAASAALNVTIDTTAPSAPSIASFSPDTGTVGDHITDASTLTLTGTAEANSTVKVYDGATLLGTASTNGSGAWSYTTAALSNGGHNLTATATDAAGNVSTASGAMAVTVDTVAPVAPTFSVNGVGGTLALDGHGFTNKPTWSNSASVSLTTTKANDVIILDVVQNGFSVNTVTDTAGLTWHQRAVTGSAGQTISEYYAIAPNALSGDSITVATASAASYTDLNAFAVSGANTASPFDNNVFTPVTAASSTAAVTTSNANDMIIAGYRFAFDATPAAGSGWTTINAASGYYLSEYKIVSTTQAGLVATASTADQNGGIVDAIVQATTTTSANVLTLTGAAEANATINVYDGATLLGTTTTNGSGAWSFTTGTLADGTHNLSATATDVAGNVSVASSATAVTVDTTAPVAPSITSFSPDTGIVGDHITDASTVTLTGTAEANSTVKVYDGATLLGTASTNSSGAWSFTAGTLASGAHSLTATATDAAGNVSVASSAMPVTVDTVAPVAPTIASLTPDNGIAIATGSGTLALDGHGFTNKPTWSNSTSVSLTTTKANDVIILDVVQNGSSVNTVTDTAGLTWHQRAVTGSGSQTISEYYAIAPNALSGDSITVATAGAAFYTDLNAFAVSGANTASPFDNNLSTPVTAASSTAAVTTSNANDMIIAGYRFASDAAPAAGSGWTTINAASGYYLSEYKIVSTTQAGLVATASTADQNGGIVDAIAQASSTLTSANVLTLTGTTEANSMVQLYDGVTLLGSVTANGSGAWNITTGTLADGTHSLSATATDVAGNVSIASSAMAVTVDTTAPVAPSITSFSPDTGIVGDHITDASTLTLTGTAEANSTLKVYDGATLLGSTTVNANGAWSFATASLTDGTHSFTTTDTDVLGHTSVSSSTVNVTVDSHVPAAPSIATFSPDTDAVGDGFTSATVLNLSGTAEDNSTVNVYDGTTALGTTTTSSTGTWSFATPQLANGTHIFTATATDAAGTSSAASSALNVVVSPTAPTVATIGASNTINVGAGNNLITGNTASDTFVFGTAIGNDVVTNFKTASTSATDDVLQFSHNTFNDFASVLAHASQAGADVVIAVDATDAITLKNFQLSNLHQTNIHIV